MKYEIIGSSSKGNCIVVEDVLMLDCGVSYAKIKPYLKNAKLIFISHIHKDHLLPSTIQKIAYNKPTMKFVTGSKQVVRKLDEIGVNRNNIIYLYNYSWFDLGIVKLKLEPMRHDAENYGLHFKKNSKKGLYIVDTANIDNVNARHYDLYLIEANYKEEVLERHKKECTQEELVYLNRVPQTHLSWEQANTFLIENMGENSEYQYIHESSYNFEGDE